MNTDVQLLSLPKNYAVVQLPGRKFPGVVFQGDSLHSLCVQAREASAFAENGDIDVALLELKSMRDQLNEILFYFEKTCLEKGIPLPYPSDS